MKTSNLEAVPVWQYHVAAIVIFFVWLELMLLVGRFPIFGLYVQMFTKGKKYIFGVILSFRFIFPAS